MSRLAKINWNDATNGNGVCVSIFLQGCPHHCPGCFNQETWDPAGGQPIDFPKFIRRLIDKIRENGVERGLSFLGGEPLVNYNLEFVDKVITIIKAIYPSTPVYIWTGGIFEYHKQGEAVAGISDRQVTLPSGGYLVIDHTEAMTVIDVNSGKFSGRENLEETIMQINREAALEIARQLRLRDIGGIIVVDFIDMHTDNHKREIMNSLQQALKGDKMHPKVQDITVLNLVEITRKKSRQNLSSVLYTPCPVCNGSGRVQSRENLSLEIKRRLRTLLKRRSSSKNLLITANPWLAEWLVSKDLRAWERELACSLKVEADASLHVESFMILDNSGVDK